MRTYGSQSSVPSVVHPFAQEVSRGKKTPPGVEGRFFTVSPLPRKGNLTGRQKVPSVLSESLLGLLRHTGESEVSGPGGEPSPGGATTLPHFQRRRDLHVVRSDRGAPVEHPGPTRPDVTPVIETLFSPHPSSIHSKWSTPGNWMEDPGRWIELHINETFSFFFP